KAVRYFFEAPGVPQWLAEVNADLLLAYRGSLALRADRRRHSRPRRAPAARRDTLWSGAPGATLPSPDGATPQNDMPGATASAARPAALRQGPLSPATVNIRLTALRQFLLFASERGALAPDLTPERVRSTLRRLRNERRRPYQTLAEEEWGEFLQAALSPAERPMRDSLPTAAETPTAAGSAVQRGPWGVTRAARERQRADTDAAPTTPDATDDPGVDDEDESARAHDHRTGAHTAQRDHALISLALATGLRAIELSLLDVGDITSERRRGRVEWWLNLPDEKTKGQRGGRTLPLAPELIATLFAYIRSTGRAWEQPEHRTTPLFLALNAGRRSQAESASQAVVRADGTPARRYRRLRPEQIRGVIHRVEEQWLAQRRARDGDTPEVAGEARHLSPHALRHSAAIALLLGDEASERPPASVEHVRGWLGHFDIRTTQRYLSHIESREQRRRFAIRPQTRRPPAEAPETAPDNPDQPSLFDSED
ncbi:MAG: site-specific integrase, partial [Chloroflexota bacterium]|nr:site-specific integrase [Chloroflexota bacterium]